LAFAGACHLSGHRLILADVVGCEYRELCGTGFEISELLLKPGPTLRRSRSPMAFTLHHHMVLFAFRLRLFQKALSRRDVETISSREAGI
jgi:hypothetical protein